MSGEPWDEGSDAIDVTLSRSALLLLQRHPAAARPWDGTLDRSSPGGSRPASSAAARERRAAPHRPVRDGHFDSMPPLRRTSMAPEPMERRLLRRWSRRLARAARGARAHARVPRGARARSRGRASPPPPVAARDPRPAADRSSRAASW
jgi:hypothetical protein